MNRFRDYYLRVTNYTYVSAVLRFNGSTTLSHEVVASLILVPLLGNVPARGEGVIIVDILIQEFSTRLNRIQI